MSRNFQIEDRKQINVASNDAPSIPLANISPTGVPQPVDISNWTGPSLPSADIVVVTWTDQEWNALDHVFRNSTTTRSPGTTSWQKDWKQYTRGASSFSSDGEGGELWGKFQLVTIGGRKVLLFKSDAHLAHPPWINGLRAMTQT